MQSSFDDKLFDTRARGRAVAHEPDAALVFDHVLQDDHGLAERRQALGQVEDVLLVALAEYVAVHPRVAFVRGSACFIRIQPKIESP